MADEQHAHDNHGRTPANWTGATIIMVAAVVATLGVVLAQPIVFWVGMGLLLVGAVVWKVMLGMESDHEDVG